MNKKAPCFGCPDRFPGCHAVCLKYEAWRLTKSAENSRAKEQNNVDAATIASIYRIKEFKRKKKRR